MASFPPEWSVFSDHLFLNYSVEGSADSGIGAIVLLQMREDGRARDNFRVQLFGNVLLTSRITATDILAIPELGNIALRYGCYPADAAPRLNMTTSAWLDVEDLIRAGNITPLDADDNEVDTAAVLAHLNSAAVRKNAVGASIRWAVGVDPGNKLQLMLQALPIPAKFLTSDALTRADNVPVVCISKIPLSADLFDESHMPGRYRLYFLRIRKPL